MTSTCILCHRESQRGYESPSKEFICLSCCGETGLVRSSVIPCGQSCRSFEGWTHLPKKTRRQEIRRLKKGDVIPACPHRIKVKVHKVKEMTPHYTEVIVRDYQNPRLKFLTRLYGSPREKVWIQ